MCTYVAIITQDAQYTKVPLSRYESAEHESKHNMGTYYKQHAFHYSMRLF